MEDSYMSTNITQETKMQTTPSQEIKNNKRVENKFQFNGSVIPNAPLGFTKPETKKPRSTDNGRPEPCFLLNYPVGYDKKADAMIYGHLYRVNGLYGYATIDKTSDDYEKVQLIRFDKNKANGMVVVTKASARVMSDSDRRELIEKIRVQAFECADKQLRNDSLFYEFMHNGNLYENDFSKEFDDIAANFEDIDLFNEVELPDFFKID